MSGSDRAQPSVESLKEAGIERLHRERLLSLIKEAKSRWVGDGGAPDVVLLESMRDKRTPAAARRADARQRQGGATGAPKAFVDGNTVYLLEDALDTRADALKSLVHETVGHWGLRRVHGNRLDAILDEIVRKNRIDVWAKAKTYGLDTSDPAQLREAAEEVLAELAEEDRDPTLNEMLEAESRALLRQLVPEMADEPFTRAELLANFIAPVRQRMRGTSPIAPTGTTQIWYSELARAIERAPMNAGGAEAWTQLLKSLTRRGVKADEIEWSGLPEWLSLRSGKITKQQISGYLDANGVQVNEIILSDEAVTPEMGEQRFGEIESRLSDLGWQVDGDSDTAEIFRFTNDREDKEILPDQIPATRDEPYDLMREAVAINGSLDDVGETQAKYARYTLRGGQNYRELLLTLPDEKSGAYTLPSGFSLQQMRNGIYTLIGPDGSGASTGATTQSDALQVAQIRLDNGNVGQAGQYKSSHWDQPNILAHIRVDDRTDAHGKRVLFVEEIQSDWGQEGKRRGFGPQPGLNADQKRRKTELQVILDGGEELLPEDQREFDSLMLTALRATGAATIPAGPFVDKTDAWVALAIKRVIKMASDGGYDRVAFIGGQQAADLHGLSKQVEGIEVVTRTNAATGEKTRAAVLCFEDGGHLTLGIDVKGLIDNATGSGARGRLVGKPLSDVVGTDVADRVMAMGRGIISGEGLKVGGEGIRVFYDEIVPSVAKEVLRKLGGAGLIQARLKTYGFQDGKFFMEIPDGAAAARWVNAEPGRELRPGGEALPGFEITDAIRSKVARGVPMFSRQAAPIDRAASFSRWFGSSRVVDADGKPLVVYHGTLGPAFSQFDISAGNAYEGGAFFSTSPNVASHFAEVERTGNDQDEEGYEPHVIPVFLSIKDPKRLTAEDVMSDGVHSFELMRQAILQARSEGYDGAHIVGAPEADENEWAASDQWVAFEPRQIKSAIGNSGEYSRATADIRFDRKDSDEWASGTKAVNAFGEPLVLYHGTGSEFEEFSVNPRGIFFAEDPAKAEPFSRIHKGGSPRVIEAHVSIKNPWQMIRYSEDTPYSQMVDQSVDALKAKGYDGIYDPVERVWIAFSPQQIRLLPSSAAWRAEERRKETTRRIAEATSPVAPDYARALVAGRTEKPGGVDPERMLGRGEYRLGRVPLDLFVGNESGDGYDGTVNLDRARAYAERPADAAPPVIALQGRDGLLRINDGGHRITAARLRGDATISALVRLRDQQKTSAVPPRDAFNRWFDGSKIVDSEGNPLVVYHGTNRDFTVFQSHAPQTVYTVDGAEVKRADSWDMGDDRQGAPDDYHYMAILDAAQLGPEEALRHRTAEARGSDHPDPVRMIADLQRLQGKKVERRTESRPTGDGFYFSPDRSYPFIRDMGKHEGGNVMPVYLSIRNPVFLNASQIEGAGASFNVEKYKAQGYDGAVYAEDPSDLSKRGFGGSPQIVAFDANQIKSAIGNNGEFDAERDDIRFRRGSADRGETDDRRDLVGGFADASTTITRTVVVSSKGETQKVTLGNVDSAGRLISPTLQGLENFWNWYADCAVKDDADRPLALYHATVQDFSRFETMRETKNTGLFGSAYDAKRAGIFMTPDIGYAEWFVESREGASVMPVYARLENPVDLRSGLSEQLDRELDAAGYNTRMLRAVQYDWELFDEEFGGPDFVAALTKAGYDGAVFNDLHADGSTHVSYVAFKPEQVKSALGNRGTWSRSESDVRFRRATDPEPEPPAEERTDAFRRWFADSRIVDDDGSPLVVYHATDRDFSVFQPDKQRLIHSVDGVEVKRAGSWEVGADGQGEPDAYHEKAIYFASMYGSGEAIQRFTAITLENITGQLPGLDHPESVRILDDLQRLQGRRLEARTETGPTGDGSYFTPDPSYSLIREQHPGRRVMPVYLSIRNPFFIRASEDGSDRWRIELAGMQPNVEKYKEQGYDGLIYAVDATNLKRSGPTGPWTEIVAFYPHQVKSAIGNNGEFDAKNPDIRFRRATDSEPPAQKKTDSDAFKSWFGQSAVTTPSGEPLVVYHGTTNDFSIFDPKRGTIDGDFGAGLYFSNSKADVETNYAGFGPDLTNRIGRIVDQLRDQQEWEVSDEEPKSEEELHDIARSQLSAHEGATMPVYLRMERPLIIGGPDETTFDWTPEGFLDDGTWIQESGTVREFIDAMLSVDQNVSSMDWEAGLCAEEIRELAFEAEGAPIKISDIIAKLKNSPHFLHATDPNTGDSMSSELLRQIIERAGYDGIIDRTVWSKFGDGVRARIKHAVVMGGISRDTAHYIVFKPEQVKSALGNNGEFDPENPDIRFARNAAKVRKDPIARVLKSAEVITLLLESEAQSGAFDGGCLICAKAVIMAAGGGEYVRIVSEASGGKTEHYGALVGGRIYDGGGVYETREDWLEAFKRLEHMALGDRISSLSVEDGHVPESEIPDDPACVKKIAAVIVRKNPVLQSLLSPASPAPAISPKDESRILRIWQDLGDEEREALLERIDELESGDTPHRSRERMRA